MGSWRRLVPERSLEESPIFLLTLTYALDVFWNNDKRAKKRGGGVDVLWQS